jgi:hypothetical protein
MTKIADEAVVSRPPDRVFALPSYVERLPELSEETVEVETDKLIRIEGRSKSNGRTSLTEALTPDREGCRMRLEADLLPVLDEAVPAS